MDLGPNLTQTETHPKMSIENEDPAAYHRRKADQAWELSALARIDGDVDDFRRYKAEAEAHSACVREIGMDGVCSCKGHQP